MRCFRRSVNVITAAYSLVGEVGISWVGKSTKIGIKTPVLANEEKVLLQVAPAPETVRAWPLTAVDLLNMVSN